MHDADRHRERSPARATRTIRQLLLRKCTLYLFLFCLHLGCSLSAPLDSDTFAFFHEGAQGCLGVRDHSLVLSKSCEEDGQRWKWVSRGRLFNLGSSLCLGLTTGNVTSGADKSPLGVYTCDREPPRVRWTWNCGQVLDNLNNYLSSLAMLNSTSSSSAPAKQKWSLHGGLQDLCTKVYQEIYTIQGNSNGRPCFLPFLYDGQWFHGCTKNGREDGHSWCATTFDYGKDERWGFCPVKSGGCETFWDTDPLADSCYQFNFQSTLSWSEARISCQQQEADLLSITMLHEQTYINGLLTGYSAVMWIGLNDLDVNGGWQWADSSPLKYLNWEQEQPSHAEEENCAVIRTESSGRWQNRDCSVALPYVCKKRPNATLDPFTTDSWTDDKKYDCDVGWQSFQAGCYKLNSEMSDWHAARKTCQKVEANLVSIHTLPELEFIIRNFKKDSGTEQLWIGLHDIEMQMDFQWTDHSPVTFTFWHPFEPNNFRNTQEDCVSMWGSEGRWDDSPCNLTLPSICKKPGTNGEGKPQQQDCKQGWKWHSPSCYWVGEDLLTFDEAKKACEDSEANLVTIKNRFDQAFANSLLFGRSGDSFWIGLHDQSSPGTFRWLSGDDVTYANWNRDQPGSVRGGCVSMATGFATGLWEVKECATSKAKFVCRQTPDTSVSPLLPDPKPTPSLTGSCPRGWKSNGNLRHCYKVFHSSQLDQKQSWLQAHLFCREHGANLLSITSPDEEHFVMQVLHEEFGESEEHEQHWFWIGLNRRNPLDNDSWKWSDGLAVTYENFGRYYYNIRQCAAADLGSMTWLAMHCDSELDWICKIPRGSVELEPETSEGNSSPEWMAFQEAEYKFFDHRTTWDQAQRICSWFDSSLASIHSTDEENFLANTLRKMVKVEGDNWWVGLHSYENDGRLRWSDHSVLNYVAWALGRPHPLSRDRRCVHLSAAKGDWSDQKCPSDLPYICKRVNVTGTVPPTPSSPHPPAGCPDGWTSYQHKCFRVFDQTYRVTWSASKLKCEIQGGVLAMVSNHLEQAFLTTLLNNVSLDLWVGLSSDSKAHFSWTKTGLLSYTNWAPGEPVDNSGPHQNKTRGNCVVMIHGNPQKNTGMWASRACEMETNGYVCQRHQDQSIPPAPVLIPSSPLGLVELGGVTYRVIQKRLDWTGALHVCESLNGSLATVKDPYQQAYLTLLVNSLRRSAWVALYNYGGRSFTWLGEEEVSYTNWNDGEPNQFAGCAHMTTTGQWTTSPCDAKLDAAICQISGEPVSHQWVYPGKCPQTVGEWGWVPFRNNCYAFNLHTLRLQQDARSACKKVGAELLTILDETENGFVWEHIQSYAEQAYGAWLGISVKGRGLVWAEDVEMSYTNWETHDFAFSVLSPNSCFWIQSNSGLWKPGSCRNRTHGVICKQPRIEETSPIALDGDHLPTLIVVIVTGLVLVVLIVGVIFLYRRRALGSRGSYEGARYSRTSASNADQVEKNILVSDMELNEQAE